MSWITRAIMLFLESRQAKYYEIKAAYRLLVKSYHPDVNSSHSNNDSSLSNEDMIKKINAAYEVLSDKDKRNEYDHEEVVNNDGIDDDSIDNDLQQDNKADIGNNDARPADKSDKYSSSKKRVVLRC